MENSESKPGKLFKIGENDEKSTSNNEDQSMDVNNIKKAQNTIEQVAKLVALPSYTPPAFNAPIYNAPSYPGPPGFTPTTVPSATLPTATGLTPPTFTYQSAYTGETMKFDGKAYGTPEYAQVPSIPNLSKPGEDEDEMESVEIKLDIEITSLRAELQVSEKEASEFQTLQSSLTEKKESLSQLENSNRTFFYDQEYQKVQADLESAKTEQNTVQKQIKQTQNLLRAAQLKQIKEKESQQEAEKVVDQEKQAAATINDQYEQLVASLATVKRYLAQEQQESEADKQKGEESSKPKEKSTADEEQQKDIIRLENEVNSQKLAFDKVQQSHQKLELQLSELSERSKKLELEEEELYEKVEHSYREKEELTEVQPGLVKANAALQRTKFLLQEKSGHLSTTLQFLEMYLEECIQSSQESSDEQSTLKNIQWIYQQLLDLQSSCKLDADDESSRLKGLQQEKESLETEVKELENANSDQDKTLLAQNSILPESGVITKQLNAEIYQTKISIQQSEKEEESLKEKVAALQSLLSEEAQQLHNLKGEQEEKFGGFLDSLIAKHQLTADKHSIVTQEFETLISKTEELELALQESQTQLKDTQQENQSLLQSCGVAKQLQEKNQTLVDGVNSYVREFQKLIDEAKLEKETLINLQKIKEILSQLQYDFEGANQQSSADLQVMVKEKDGLDLELNDLSLAIQEQEKKNQVQNSTSSVVAMSVNLTENAISETKVQIEQLNLEEETLNSKAKTLQDLLEAEQTQILLMKSESEDSLGNFLQQLEEKHHLIDQKHQSAVNELDLAKVETLNLQSQLEQAGLDVEAVRQLHSHLTENLSKVGHESKTKQEKKQLISEYLAEIERILQENQLQSNENRDRRLLEIKRILEEFEIEKQKQVQWVDYAEQPSLVQETPSPSSDPNLLTKLKEEADLLQLEGPPENLRQPPVQDRASEAMRPSIFEMQRKNAQQQSYRATTYDKTKIKRPNLVSNKPVAHTDQTVLQDLVVCQLSGLKMLALQSDLELNQGFSLFSQMLQDDPKCHEGMFGLARINYIQGRYEISEKWLMKAYETKRDFAYRVWLGYTQLQLAKICLPENPKKQKFAQNAFSNLDRCSKEKKVGFYANFGLLQMALELNDLQVKGLQEAAYYEGVISSDYAVEGFEGPLAGAVVGFQKGQSEQSIGVLKSLCSQGLSLPYFVLIRHYLRSNQLQQALNFAEEADSKHDIFESSQERFASLVLLSKCLKRNGQPEKAIMILQERYAELPHYSSILYLFGKTVIQSSALHKVYLQSGVSALQEVQRVSCQARKAKAAFWLAEAYKQLGQSTLCGLNQQKYLTQISQVTKSGAIVSKIPENIVDARVQSLVISSIADLKWSNDQQVKDPLFLSPQDDIPGQSLNVYQNQAQEKDLVIACMKISEHRDQQLYKAMALYRLKDEPQKADNLFQNLVREYPDDVEIGLENVKFLKQMLKLKVQLRRQNSTEHQAQELLDLIEKVPVDGNMWVSVQIECSKIFSLLGEKEDDIKLKLRALECLLKIKQALPVIDTKLAAVKVPETLNRYLFEEFDHIDYQSSSNTAPQQQVVESESADFKPQDEFDETNKFFCQNQFTQTKLINCPLATLSLSEIKDQTRVKGDSLFFFGAAQTELAYEAEANSNTESFNEQQRKFYKSSTPLITVLKFLQHLERQQTGSDYKEKLIKPQFLQDYGFCVYSDPSFLFKIAKMCLKYGIFIDLAIQSLYVYRQVMSYYRNFYDWGSQEIKAKLLLALLLKKLSTQPQEDQVIIEKIVQELSSPVKQAYDKVMFLPKQKVTKFEYDSIKHGKLLLELQQT